MTSPYPKYHLAEYPHQFRVRYPNKTILRYYNKRNERWEKLSGQQVADRCLAAAKGLAYLQLQPGDRVGIYSPNRVGCIATELGLFMMRAVSVPLYATSTPDQVEFIVQDAGVETMFVGGQFQYNNAYEVQLRGGCLRRLVIFDPEVVLAPGDTTSMYYEEFIRRGDAVAYENKATVTASQALATDLAVIIYTSGTTGRSKGVMLHHSNFIEQVYAHQLKYPFISNRDVSMCFLPLNHIFEKAWSYLCLSMGCQVAILSDPKRILDALPVVRPTMMSNVPRFWEKVYIGVQEKIERTPSPLRRVMRHAIQVGEHYFFDFINEGKKPSIFLSLLYQAYDKVLFTKVKKAIGLQRGRFFPTAGASVSPEISRFFRSINVPMCVGYGLSETTATVSSQPMRGFDLESIGTIMPALQVKIDPETSEILIKGPTVTRGYYNNPEADAEAFTPDGYFRTGDAGRLEGNVLYFTERIKDLFKTANGKYIAPQMIEGLLTVDPLFEQVAVIADGYKFVSALIYPNWEALRREARHRGIEEGLTDAELAVHHEVHRMIMAHLEQNLKSVAQYEKVKKFHLLTEPFSVERGELTNTLKVRRKVVAELYAAEIASMYQE
ncbi:AMP-binding enzyme [Porphyromonas sp. oral taxon 278 str. W7784]|uniref:AMP-dependent synthetase/ligase n=1 Tax=Porphyromonas sp. oral taxon 278 TaxID=712437 RepID=UPI0003AD3838|nr:long-chain fatty acid--CoA ligase [Porphyromonas sp. oral taxon 278]ERJ71781.1 AMP-binding enzyme [Porphyromonas sp. oral taxon 278 str. W7784]